MSSKLGDVLDALQTTLETAKTGTVYEPDTNMVRSVLFWPASNAVPDGVQTFYLLRLGQRSGLSLESCYLTDTVEVFILAATRWKSISDDPFREDPTRLSVALDLEADVLSKLRADEKLANGGDPEVVDVFYAQPVTDFEKFDPAWVVIEIRLLVKYAFARTDR